MQSSNVYTTVNLTRHLRDMSTNPIGYGSSSDVYSAYLVKNIVTQNNNVDAPMPLFSSASSRSSLVALKVLRVFKDGQRDTQWEEEKFWQEVEILQGLTHPNIVRPLGVASIFTRPTIVLPMYPNGNALDYVMDLELTSQMERNKLIMGLVNAVEYLHGKNPPIVHGDIKGTNILVNDSGEAILSDFGSARVRGGLNDADSLGALRWRAPELMLGGEPTLASDVWALGCTIGELLTNKVPHSSLASCGSVVLAVTEGKHPFKEDAALCESMEMWWVMKGCLVMNPENRLTMAGIKKGTSDPTSHISGFSA